MYCTCSKENNYSVIGLCDIDKTEFSTISTTAAWTEISVPEILTIPGCKPDIEAVDKVYITAKITSTKIIETPVSPADNEEGVRLTGKKLVVNGVFCQTIIYTADELEQSAHAAHFNIPFCTFIVINGDADVESDRFCVTPCIEDVFVTVLNKRTIFKNVTLFLYAKPFEIVCAP